jgi:predicted deacylase
MTINRPSHGEIIRIGAQSVAPGQSAVIELPIAQLYTRTAMNLPVHVVNGLHPGPRLFISAAIHGDELNGVEIIRRVLQQKALRRLNGAVIAVPIVNIFGLIQHSRYLPDRRDLNRVFPGSQNGSLAAQLAYILLEDIVKKCTHGIDIHTGALHRSNLPQIRANLDDAVTLELAKAFGVPVLINSTVRDGSLREAAAENGVTMLLYEGGEALRFDELCIRAGVRGVMQVMRKLGMLPQRRQKSRMQVEPFIARSSSWVRASLSGIFRSYKDLGDYVERGEILGTVSDPSDMFIDQGYEIRANDSGIIIGKTKLPLVSQGDALYHIARFADGNEVAANLETFQQAFNGDNVSSGQINPEIDPEVPV